MNYKTGPVEELYFIWLTEKVNNLLIPTPSLRYDNLLRTLHEYEFLAINKRDENRAEDGVELRIRFLLAGEIPDDLAWRNMPCSVFEMLIALSNRAEFATDASAYFWFWHFIRNLDLYDYNDAWDYNEELVIEILNIFVWREYEPEGYGGLFPVSDTNTDQRNVEIWYQFCEYISEVDFNLSEG